ncbi:MAG: hypothetical protein ACE5HZ_06885 [Fidelibacterota bacterium]
MSGNVLKQGSIQVELYVRDDCISCDTVQEALLAYCKDRNYLSLRVVDLDNGGTIAPGKQAYITPALWVNGHLWNLGGFDLTRFDQRIRKLADNLAQSRDRDLIQKQ